MDPAQGIRARPLTMKELFTRAPESPGHLSPPRSVQRRTLKCRQEKAVSRWLASGTFFTPTSGDTLHSVHLCTEAWITAVPSWRLFMSPTQAVPRGHGGSFDEACQSILVPTAVSWEGNRNHNDPHICLRDWRLVLLSQPCGSAPAPQQRGK